MAAKLSERDAKRQLSFLHSFERKFQVLHREVQRLERLRDGGSAYAGNWPTDGLERTAKSLVGAGALYGIKEISAWAKEFLVGIDVLHKNSAPPSETDIEWLEEQLVELKSLHSSAVSHVENILSGSAQAKKPESKPVAKAESEEKKPNSKQAKKPESKPAAKSESKSKKDKDPEVNTEKAIPEEDAVEKNKQNAKKSKKRKIPQSSISPDARDIDESGLFADNAPHLPSFGETKQPENNQRDSANGFPVNDRDTMPVEIDDFIDVPSEVSSGATPPPLPIKKGKSVKVQKGANKRSPWPIVAVVLVLLLGVSVYFNLAGTFSASESASPGDSPAQTPKKKSKATKTVSVVASTETNSSTAVDTSEGTGTDTSEAAQNDPAAVSVKAAGGRKADARLEKAAPLTTSKKSVPKAGSTSRTTGKKAAKPAASAGPTGKLNVLAPIGAVGKVQIFVDGNKRGKAPKTLNLDPGLHEITFVNGEKRSLKMVSIKEGASKDVTPKF